MVYNKKPLRRRKEHRKIFEMIKESDLTLQILDARYPQRCRSKIIEEFVQKHNKKLLCVINKADLIPQEIADQWKSIINKDFPTTHVSSSERQGTSLLRKAIRRNSKDKEILICIVGYPNVGKSSLINVLKGKKSAPTSPRAGFTRHLRTVKITEGIKMIDTPGIAPRENLTTEQEVFLGTLSAEDITDPDLVFLYIVDQFKNNNMIHNLEKYLGFPITENIDELLMNFAKRRGLIEKDGEPNPLEAARIIIRDFSSGKITYYEEPKK